MTESKFATPYDEIDAWKTASGLEVQGCPEMVTPAHLERYISDLRDDAKELCKHLRELLRMYCLVQRCELRHPCPENIVTLQPMYTALAAQCGDRAEDSNATL